MTQPTDTFTFTHHTSGLSVETITMTVAGDGVNARDLRHAFGRFMVACGYCPSTVDEVLGDWTDPE